MSRFAILAVLACWLLPAVDVSTLRQARDRRDRAELERRAKAAQQASRDAAALYEAALAWSYLVEVNLELQDREAALEAAEHGKKAAEEAVRLAPNVAEYHRLLGTLCGQLAPSSWLAGMKYGRCAQKELAKALELDPKSSMTFVSRGIGYLYTPEIFGGGTQKAIDDLRKAIELDASNADAYLWLGLALRKAGKNAEAREALERAVQLNPQRIWAKEQLAKTPPR
jgi:tetratricopeptide (TPR) repeat protein